MDYLVPDYFPHFSCKVSACRHACCEGWPISISMTDYFKLLSVECSPELRRKLDISLHLAQRPTPEGYAQILPGWDGQCPLHLPDGRCALHAELGDGVLAAVCRLYPRGVRQGEDKEISCANSCEAVLEMLLDHPEPLTFVHHEAAFDMPEPPRVHYFFTGGREQAIRLWLIGQLQQRAYPLARRMLLLGKALHAMEEAMEARDGERISRLLSGEEPIAAPDMPAPTHEQLMEGLRVAEGMLEVIDRHSQSVHDYGVAALDYFGKGEEAFRRYGLAAAQLEETIPQWETWMEHMLVNHMFFVQFPFQDRPVPLRDEYLSLCAVYVLLRFLCLGQAAEHPQVSAVVDAAAAAFRLADHTSFDLYAAPLMKELGCNSLDQWRQVICL